MKSTLTLIFVFVCFTQAISQDTTKVLDNLKLSWESYNCYAPNSAKPLLPQSIDENRFLGSTILDNPLDHGATTFGLRIESELIKNYRIDVRLMAEHRGISYGVFNTKSMIVYPIFKFSFVDTLRFSHQKWIISGTAGQELNFKQGEGLYIYNLNCHAERLRLQFKPNLIFEVFHIGDLSNGIGLGLDEVFQQSFIFPRIPLSKKADKFLNLKISLTEWRGIRTFHEDTLSPFYNPVEESILPEIMASINAGKSSKFYAHFALKATQKPYRTDSAVYYTPTNTEKMAAVIGFNGLYKTSKWAIETTAEARFYGKAFNYERSSDGAFYRGQGNFGLAFNYNSTIGRNLYPLASYDRPFSQWGVFTEYQNKNVGALTLRLKGTRQLKNLLYWYFDADYNVIFGENEKPFHYLFGSTGLNYKFRGDIDCVIGMTNKGMNLDVSYPTFYFFSMPNFLIFLKKTL